MTARALEGAGKQVQIVTGPAGNSPFDTGLDAMRVSAVAAAGAAAGAFTVLAKTVGTSPVLLSAASVPAPRGFTLQADVRNTGLVYYGPANTLTAGTAEATDGYQLEPGQERFVAVDDLQKVWLVASAAGQKVFAFVA